jgi:hypothetical protein
MTFAQRRNRLTMHFSKSIPVVKRRVSLLTAVHSTKEAYMDSGPQESETSASTAMSAA